MLMTLARVQDDSSSASESISSKDFQEYAEMEKHPVMCVLRQFADVVPATESEENDGGKLEEIKSGDAKGVSVDSIDTFVGDRRGIARGLRTSQVETKPVERADTVVNVSKEDTRGSIARGRNTVQIQKPVEKKTKSAGCQTEEQRGERKLVVDEEVVEQGADTKTKQQDTPVCCTVCGTIFIISFYFCLWRRNVETFFYVSNFYNHRFAKLGPWLPLLNTGHWKKLKEGPCKKCYLLQDMMAYQATHVANALGRGEVITMPRVPKFRPTKLEKLQSLQEKSAAVRKALTLEAPIRKKMPLLESYDDTATKKKRPRPASLLCHGSPRKVWEPKNPPQFVIRKQ